MSFEIHECFRYNGFFFKPLENSGLWIAYTNENKRGGKHLIDNF